MKIDSVLCGLGACLYDLPPGTGPNFRDEDFHGSRGKRTENEDYDDGDDECRCPTCLRYRFHTEHQLRACSRCCWLCFANMWKVLRRPGKDHVSGAIATRSVVLINLIWFVAGHALMVFWVANPAQDDRPFPFVEPMLMSRVWWIYFLSCVWCVRMSPSGLTCETGYLSLPGKPEIVAMRNVARYIWDRHEHYSNGARGFPVLRVDLCDSWAAKFVERITFSGFMRSNYCFIKL